MKKQSGFWVFRGGYNSPFRLPNTFPFCFQLLSVTSKFVFFTLLFLFSSFAVWCQTNASSLPVGANLLMGAGSILNMDVDREFGTLTVSNTTNNNTQPSIITGGGIAIFSTIAVNGEGNPNTLTTLIIDGLSTVECVSVSAGGSRPKSATINGTLRVSGAVNPIAATGWNTFTIGPASTVEYLGANQAVYNDNYHNLILSGSGTKTLQTGTTNISGNFTMGGTATATTVVGLTVVGNAAIGNGSTFTVGSNFPLAVSGSTTIGGGTSGTFVLGGTGAKTFSGNVLVNNGAVWNETGIVPISFGGSLTNNGAYTANTAVHTFSGAASTFAGSNLITIPNTTISGTYTNNGTLVVSTALSGSGSLSQGTNATLRITGSSTISTLNASATGNTVNYNGTAQTVFNTNYFNLGLSGSGIKTLQSNTSSVGGGFTLSGTVSTSAVRGLSIGGNVTIGAGTTFSAGAFTHQVGGSWIKNGTANTNLSTLVFNGANITQTITGTNTFGNLRVSHSGSGTVNATGSTLTVPGLTEVLSGTFIGSGTFNTFNISSGANFTVPASESVSLSGDLTSNGQLIPNTSTFLLSGAARQTLAGTANLNFHNLTVNNPAGVKANTDLTVNGILNLVSLSPNARDGSLDMVANYGNYSNIITASENLTTTMTQSHDILDSKILNMGATASTLGSGEVTGKVRRTTFVNNTEYTFGNPNTSLIFSSNGAGVLPSAILFIITKGPDRGVHANMPQAVQRLYQVIRTGGTAPTTYAIKLNYAAAEINGNTDNGLVLWDHHIPYVSANTPHEHGKTTQSFSDNWVQLTGHGIQYLQTGEAVGGQTKYWMIRNTFIEGNRWLGAATTGWNATPNWSAGFVPTDTTNVIIPSITESPRVAIVPQGNLSSPGATVKSVTIDPEGELDGSDGYLLIKGGIKNNGGVGSWTNNGKFLPGTSTVVFDYPRTSQIETSTVSGSGATNFYTLINSTGTVLVPQANAVLGIGGVFTNQGIFDATTFPNTVDYNGDIAQTLVNPNGPVSGYSNLRISGEGNKTFGGNFDIYNDFKNNGTGTVLPNNTTITFKGAERQILSGISETPFYNLTLDNGLGISLDSGISVANTLTLSQGIIDTNDNKLTLGTPGFAGEVTGAGSSRFIYGVLKRYVPNVENLNLDFPVGDDTAYTPINLNFSGITSGSGFLEASSAALVPAAGELPDGAGLSAEKVIGRRWKLSNSGVGGFTDYSAVLNFVATDVLGNANPNSLFARRLLLGNWTDEQVGVRTASSTEVISLSSFGEFALGEGCTFRFEWLGLTSDWNDPNNWCGNQVPLLGETETILIPQTANDPIILGTVSISLSGEVIIREGAKLILKPGSTFTLNTNSEIMTETNAMLVLESGSKYNNLGLGTPVLEVHQLLDGVKGWRMLGSPVMTTYADFLEGMVTQGFPGSNFSTLQPNLLWWSETDKGTSLQGWRRPSNSSEMVSLGRGHYAFVFNGATKPSDGLPYGDNLPITLKSTGIEPNIRSTPFNFGVSFTRRDTSLIVSGDGLLEVNVSDEGFNLLANPSASVIDYFGSGWVKTNVDETIYVWDPNANSGQGSFLTSNGNTGNLNSGRLAPFQGFWVKTNASSPVLTFGNTAKSFLSRDYVGRKLTQDPLNIQLQLQGEGMKADSYISFSELGKEGQDRYDAYQLESLSDNWLLLYTYGSLRTSSPLVINHLPALDQQERSIPLHIAAAKGGKALNGNYSLYWELPTDWPSEVSLVLMDHLQQKAIDMTVQNGYDFNFKAPEILGTTNSKLMNGGMKAPSAVVFRSPYETGEPNQRVNPSTPKRPFSILVGGEYLGGEITYRPDFPKLFAPVPNPFRTNVKIKFYFPIETEAEIRVLDMNGVEKAFYPYKKYNAGIQEIEMVGGSLAAGMYIVQLISEGQLLTQKLIKN